MKHSQMLKTKLNIIKVILKLMNACILRWYCFLLLLYAISRQKSTICCDRALKKYKCTFIIAADKDDINRFLPSKYTPSKVSQRVEKRLKEKFTMKCLTIMKISHSSEALIHALKNNPCICGVIYIGHASIDPSRLIFTKNDSIAVLPENYFNTPPGRKSYKVLPYSNLLPGNVSALFGCRTAKGGIISISARLSQLFKGTVVGATGKINFDSGDPKSPGKEPFEIFTTSSTNSPIPPECCCNEKK